MTGRTGLSRRGFLKRAAAAAGAAAAPYVLPSDALGSPGRAPAGERITMGFIGVGSHGVGMNLRSFLPQKDAQAVAVCDVDAVRMRSAK
ncbi:MAG: twin-arginine translocation signal domain-containing protein, partial [Phycisphaerae bacterium]